MRSRVCSPSDSLDLLFDDLTNPRLTLPIEAPRLLIVDDDAAMRELLGARLGTDGYQVALASGAEEAIEALTSATERGAPAAFDLLLSDHRMRGWSGLALLSELRALGWSLPLMLMTAFPDRVLHDTTALLDIELIEKPFGLDQISAAIARLLVAHATVPPTLG